MRPEAGGYRPQLDGLRAACVLLTVAHHIPGKPTWIDGSFGVDIFFAISGWLITTLLLAPGPVGWSGVGRFYGRRLFRIIPLYGLTILAYAALTGLLAARGDPVSWGQYLTALPYLATLNYEYRPDAAGVVFGHAWTLGVEEKFYLLWPALLALFARRWWAAGLLAGAAAAALVLLSPDAQWLLRGYVGIGAGATLALAARRWPAVVQLLERRAAAWVSVAVMAGLYLMSLAAPHPWGWNVAVSSTGAALAGALWLQPASGPARALAVEPLPWLGRLSYGIYLIHALTLFVVLEGLPAAGLPLISPLMFVLAFSGATFAAWGLHWTVERPMIALGRRLTRRT